MAAPLFLAAVLLPVLGAPVSTLGLGSNTEVRVRSPDALDVSQLSTARLEVTFRRLRLGVEYAPVLTFTDIDSDPTVDFLNQGEVSSEYQYRKLRLRLAERASYGSRNFAGLSTSTYDLVETETGVQIVPVAASVNYASSDTSLAATYELDPRWGLGLTLGYVIEGGIDDRSRRVIPQIVGPRADLDVRYGVTRDDTLTTSLQGETTTTDTGSLAGVRFRTNIVRGLERWSRSWDARTSSDIGGGVAVVHVDPSPTGDIDAYPVVSGSVQHLILLGRRRETLRVGAAAELNVNVDRLTGLPDRRIGANLESVWTREPYSVTARVGASHSIGNTNINQVSVLEGLLGGRYELTRSVAFEAGFRSAYQIVDSPTSFAVASAGSGFNWVVYAAAILETPLIPL